MRSLFFYTIGIAFALGIFIRSFFDFGWGGAVLGVAIGVGSFFAWRLMSAESSRQSLLFLLGIACVFISLGMLRMHSVSVTQAPLQEYEGRAVSLSGTIVREPELRASTVHLYVAVVDDLLERDAIVLVTTDHFNDAVRDLAYNDIVRVDGVLTVPEAFATDGGRTFDYPGYLRGGEWHI